LLFLDIFQYFRQILGTPAILPGKGTTQVIEKKVVGDTGFEPVTSTG
jgi:hypothetical protein